MSLLDSIKLAGSNFIEGLKEKLTTEKENTDNTIIFSSETEKNSDGKSLETLMLEYADTKNTLENNNKKEALQEKENELMLELYEKLENTVNEEQKQIIKDQIKAAESNAYANNIMLDIENSINESNLSESEKSELMLLYEKAANPQDDSEKELIQEEINQYLSEIGIDKNSYFAHNLNYNLLIVQESFKESQLYSRLSSTTDSEERNNIKNELNIAHTQFSIEANEFDLKENIALLDISENLKEELTDLYEKLTKTGEKNEKDALTAQIEEIALSNNIPKEIIIQMNLDATDIAYDKQIEENYQLLAKTTDKDEQEIINATITAIVQEKNTNINEHKIQEEIYRSDLSTEQKETLGNLYKKLNSINNTEIKDKVRAEIANYLIENNIDENSVFLLKIEDRQLDIDASQKNTELYKKLSECNNSQERNAILNEINQNNAEFIIKSGNLSSKSTILESNIPSGTKEELLSLYEHITNTTDSTELKILENKIQNILDNTEFDPDTNEKKLLSRNLLNIVENIEEGKEYKRLAGTTDADEIAAINATLQTLYIRYSARYEELNTKLEKEKYTPETNDTIKSDDKEFNKIAKTIRQMGYSIPKNINSIDELKDYLEEIKSIIEEELDDSFGSFG